MKTVTSSGRQPTVLITGYRGLAESLISELSRHGCRLSVLVRSPAAVEELTARYPEHQFVLGDVASGADGKRWVESSYERFQAIDCLINNAAISGPGGKLNDVSFVDFRLAIDVDFLAPVRLTKFVLPYFLKSGSGTIINLSGGGATGPRPGFSAYAAAKCALVRFTETIAMEYPEQRFYAISPGSLMTPMIEKVLQMDSTLIGHEFHEAERRSKEGGDDPLKAARLILWLLENRPQSLNGALISAIWDDYQSDLPETPHWWRLRRVDAVLERTLKES